jgi:outer membrane protein TolC
VTAFGQVADSLTAIEHDGEMVATSKQAVDIAKASVTLQRSSYASGRTSALQLIIAEDTYSNVLQGYTRALGQRLADTAQLFIAVGGGWWSETTGPAQE